MSWHVAHKRLEQPLVIYEGALISRTHKKGLLCQIKLIIQCLERQDGFLTTYNNSKTRIKICQRQAPLLSINYDLPASSNSECIEHSLIFPNSRLTGTISIGIFLWRVSVAVLVQLSKVTQASDLRRPSDRTENEPWSLFRAGRDQNWTLFITRKKVLKRHNLLSAVFFCQESCPSVPSWVIAEVFIYQAPWIN